MFFITVIKNNNMIGLVAENTPCITEGLRLNIEQEKGCTFRYFLPIFRTIYAKGH
jgi:hypothetical protein